MNNLPLVMVIAELMLCITDDFYDQNEESFIRNMRMLDMCHDCLDGRRSCLDWEWLHNNGKLCRNDYKVFEQLKDININGKTDI